MTLGLYEWWLPCLGARGRKFKAALYPNNTPQTHLFYAKIDLRLLSKLFTLFPLNLPLRRLPLDYQRQPEDGHSRLFR